MRINRLDLTRYGRFTDHVLDFGAADQGKPDLHIIYGPNEAGKSTTFSALLDLLFGIEHKSRYDFLHSYSAMKIGASLQLQGATQELVRTKARNNSLSDPAGRVLPETLISDELGDIDRNAYRMMFSLDDDTLEEGGDAILASKGNLGELLFSASAGLAGISQNLNLLRSRADQFYRSGGRTGGLVDLNAQLKELETAKAELDAKSSAQSYGKLSDSFRQAEAEYQQALTAHGQIRGRIAEIEAMLNALPHYHRLHRLREELAAFADIPAVPAGFADEQPRLMIDDAELRVRVENQSAEIARLEREIAEIHPDENALNLATSAGHLQDLQARFVTAEKDLPEREAALRAEQHKIEALLFRLGRDIKTDPRTLLINIQTETALRSLIEQRSGITAALQMTGKELAAAEERLKLAQDKLKQSGITQAHCDPASMRYLHDMLNRLRSEDLSNSLRLADQAAREEEAQLHEIWQALPYRQDDFETDLQLLATMAVPDVAEVEAAGRELQALQNRWQQTQDNQAKNTDEMVQLRAQLKAVQQNSLVITQEQAAELRQNRNAAWQQHRKSLSTESADAFEQYLTQDDQAVHNRLTQAAEFARAMQLRERLAVLEAQNLHLQNSGTAAQTELQAVEARLAIWQQQLVPVCKENLTAGSLLRWMEKREALQQKRQLFLRACRLRDEKLAQIRQAEADLTTALQQVGVAVAETGLSALQAQATALHESFQLYAGLQAELAEREQELHRRCKEAAEVEAQDVQWQKDWASTCQATWLGQTEVAPVLDEVREILNLMAELAPALERSHDLAQRIHAMHDDQAAYRRETEALAQRLGLPVQTSAGEGIPVAELAMHSAQHIRKAEDEYKKLQELQGRLAEAEQHRLQLNQKAGELNAKKQAMLTQLQADTLEDAGFKIQAGAKKTQLEQVLTDEEQTIAHLLKLAHPAEAEDLLAQADSGGLKEQLLGLREQDEAQDRHKQEQYRLKMQAEQLLREAQAGDDSAAKLDEQRRTLLLEIEEKSKQYLRLRFGISAAEQALRLYRDQHRSSMMAQASAAFAAISQGSYRQLTTQTDKDSEILIAVAADGSSKTADQLSKGTRFQLYLALRIAGYYEFVSRRPMPFIADDIMETFDDDRARETFRLFTQMAGQGQVIYLTHHQHLCEIAQDVYPDVRLHQL